MELFNATLDDYELRILDISDTLSTSVVRHEFVGTDGGVLENLGNKIREIKFKAFFYGIEGQAFSASYPNHYDFVEDIRTREIHTLIHPKYGRIKGSVQDIAIIHNDTQDYVEIDITFVEDGLKRALVSGSQSIAKIVDLQEVAMLNNAITATKKEIADLGHSGILGKTIDTSKTFLDNFTKVSDKTRQFVKSVSSFVTKVDSFMADIEAPVLSITAAINYVGDVPSTIVGSIQTCTDRIVNSFQALGNLPVQLINSSIIALRSLMDSITGENSTYFRSKILSIGAGVLSAKSGYLLQDDETLSKKAAGSEGTQVFDLNGRRIGTSLNSQVMSSTEMEALAYNIRSLIQEAIDADRNNQDLKNMANSIILYVDDVKLRRAQQINMLVNNIPLHMLCLNLGLDYQAAERLLKINPTIKNPTFCEGNLKVYVS